MKFLLIGFLFFSVASNAQWKSFKLTPRGDTLNRLDQRGVKHGPWSIHVDDLRGERGYEEEGYFENDKKVGTWRQYSLQGDLIAIENYRWGFKDGRNQYFNFQGEPIREEFWRAIDPKNPYDTVKVYDLVDPNKVIGTKVIKIETSSVKHGVWRYFDPYKGTVEKTERWVMDRLKTKDEEDEGDDMAPIDVTKSTTKKTEVKKEVTKPKEVLEFEKKNAGKKKIKVRDGRTGG